MVFIFPLLAQLTAVEHFSALTETRNSPLRSDSGITKEQFLQISDDIFKIYGPLVKQHGFNLEVNLAWGNNRVFATIERLTYDNPTDRILNLSGGLARQEGMTGDAFSLIVCHEYSHLVTGLPSTEGQADYLAVSKCLRHYWEKADNKKAASQQDVPVTLKNRCKEAWGSSSDYWMCLRTGMAGLTFMQILAKNENVAVPHFETPDLSAVEWTDYQHPSAQCRLDTYLQASICEVSHHMAVDSDSDVTGMCDERLGHKKGLRPSCWYKSPL